jgi:chromosome partitioning protein
MYESDTRAWLLTDKELVKGYGSYLFETVIPKNTTLTEAEFFHKPAILYNLKALGSQAYLSLTKEILLNNPD